MRCVVFDLDGVLLDSWPLMRVALGEALLACSSDLAPPFEAFRSHLGRPLPEIAAALDLPAGFVAAYEGSCRRHAHLASLYPGASGALANLRGRGLLLALATGKSRVRTLEILRHFELESLFTMIVAGDDVSRGKPHPESVERILAALALTPPEVVFVGDSPLDIACASAASVRALGACWGLSERAELLSAGPTALLGGFGELLDLIERLSLAQAGEVQ